MKNVKWGIDGYLVLIDNKVIGQFDNCGWAYEFQQMVADKRLGQPVTMLCETGNSTLVHETAEQPIADEVKEPPHE